MSESESDSDEIPGQRPFHESAYTHGVACGMQERYDISDNAYSLLVYGMEVPIRDDGNVAREDGEAVALFSIMPPMMPGGVPAPIEIPMMDDSEPFTIDSEAESLTQGDIVAFYDSHEETTRTGMVSDVDEPNELAELLVDDDNVIAVQTAGNTKSVTINGNEMGGKQQMANDDDEHLKSWWRVEKLENMMEDDE